MQVLWLVLVMLLMTGVLVEFGIMMYLWFAVYYGYGDFENLKWGLRCSLVEDIEDYLLFCVWFVFVGVRGPMGLVAWAVPMLKRGDEATRLAVDAMVALVTRQDITSFEYRANVGVWWIKVAIQCTMVLMVLVLEPLARRLVEEDQARMADEELDLEEGQVDHVYFPPVQQVVDQAALD